MGGIVGITTLIVKTTSTEIARIIFQFGVAIRWDIAAISWVAWITANTAVTGITAWIAWVVATVGTAANAGIFTTTRTNWHFLF